MGLYRPHVETGGVSLLATDAVCALSDRVSPHDHLIVLLQQDVEGLVRGTPGMLQRLCCGHRGRVQEDGELLGNINIHTQLAGGRRRLENFSPGIPLTAAEINPVAAEAIVMTSGCAPLLSR